MTEGFERYDTLSVFFPEPCVIRGIFIDDIAASDIRCVSAAVIEEILCIISRFI